MSTKELTLVPEEVTGTAIADPRTLYVAPTPAQIRRKPIAPAEVEKVIRNQPMPRVPRSHETTEDPGKVTERLLSRIFPQFTSIFTESKDDGSWKSFDRAIEAAVAEHKTLGMTIQARSMKQQADTYKALRSMFLREHDFLRPDSIIPMDYLPDLFMAVPVWYFWENPEARSSSGQQLRPEIRQFAQRFPSTRWSDTFLMFNYRFRSLREYNGDLIPPKILSRISTMGHLCEHLVVMTPYHDVAGQEWQSLIWPRNIDPYVIGFLKNMPFMIVLGRFSDSGTFPLYSEMIADTIAFLRTNKEKLKGFNSSDTITWPNGAGNRWSRTIGNDLIKHTDELIAAFEKGNLFDWLRGEEPKEA